MSDYYNPIRKRYLYDPNSREPFRLSRSKIDLFINCPRCFYLDRRLGRGQPPGYPFTLNSAVDKLLKKEFDLYRKEGKPHPLMVRDGIDAIPFSHPKLDHWREAFTGGVEYVHPETNFRITGAVDDIWMKSDGSLYVVDYKATSKEELLKMDNYWLVG
jgi:RecB family exonuclease